MSNRNRIILKRWWSLWEENRMAQKSIQGFWCKRFWWWVAAGSCLQSAWNQERSLLSWKDIFSHWPRGIQILIEHYPRSLLGNKVILIDKARCKLWKRNFYNFDYNTSHWKPKLRIWYWKKGLQMLEIFTESQLAFFWFDVIFLLWFMDKVTTRHYKLLQKCKLLDSFELLILR